MPASSAEVIGAALQSAYRHRPTNTTALPNRPHVEDQILVSSKQVLVSHVEYESAGRQQSLVLDSLKSKYVTLNTTAAPSPASPPSSMAHAPHRPTTGAREDQLEEPQVVLWSRDKVTLGWRKTFPPGAGMVNLGNTCYLNSSLQALFHIPALANWLLEELQSHTQRCEANTANASFCSVCAMMRTFRSTLDRSTSVIKPSLIQHKLKSIGKTLMYGRQEDAHEFIKLLLDHMEKSYLTFRRASKLDHRSKETTPLNQIFGGYIRQQVICPLCRYVSTTFSHFQDLVLDIRSVNSVDDALNLHFKKETLDVDNAYKCERCHKKVPATKRHLIERAPHVLLIQLKRFTMSGGKIGKHINIQRTIDISRFVSGCSGGSNKQSQGGGGSGPYQYRLASMVIHLGGSQHGGHYTAVAEASSGTMFEYDDSSVRSISVQSALMRNPYILFYEMIRKPKEQPSHAKQVVRQSSEKVLIRQNSDGVTKPLPTSHSASSVTNGFPHHAQDSSWGDVGAARGMQHTQSKPPLPTHKERERISFGLKQSQTVNKVDTSKPSKIILNSGTTSLLATKPSVTTTSKPSAPTTGSSKPPVTTSKPLVSSSGLTKPTATVSTPTKPSVSSSSSSKLSVSSTGSIKSSVTFSSSSKSSAPAGSSMKASVPSSKSSTNSSGSSKPVVSTSILPKSSIPSGSSKSYASASGSPSSPSGLGQASTGGRLGASLVPYPDDSEDSEIDDSRRGMAPAPCSTALQNGQVKGEDPKGAKVNGTKSAKGDRPNGSLSGQRSDKFTNGEALGGEGESGAKGGPAFMPRSLQVVTSVGGAGGCRGKLDSGWQVTDAALHSPSEGSGSSGSGPGTFTVVEQPTSSWPDQRPTAPSHERCEHQGWTVTVRRPRPTLEKSLSQDCVLPGTHTPKEDSDSASLKSKASVDSGRSDRSTKSMKKSLFSLFTCVSSTRSPEGPEDSQPEALLSQEGTKSTREKRVAAEDSGRGGEPGCHTVRPEPEGDLDPSQAKRVRDQEEGEPSSPSKKCCPEDQIRTKWRGEDPPPHGAVTSTTTSTGSKNGPSNSGDKKTKNSGWGEVAGSKNGAVLLNGASKNGFGESGHANKEPRPASANTTSVTTNGSVANGAGDTKSCAKDSSSSVSASSLSSSSTDSESSEGEEEQGGTERWVEKTKETIGKAKICSTPHVVQWNGTSDLSHGRGRGRGGAQEPAKKKTGLWDGSRSSEVVDELRRAGNFAYGTKVSTWGGGRTLADQEGEKERKEAKKRSSGDLYNEEMDCGRTKKPKVPKKGWNSSQSWNNHSSPGNQFQRVQDAKNAGTLWTPHQRSNPNHHRHPNSYYSSPPGPRYPYWNKNRNNPSQQHRPWNRQGKQKFHSKKYKEKYKYW